MKKKMNMAALEKVCGGTKTENMELEKAIGVDDVCIITLQQMLFYDYNVISHLHALACSPNEYHDADTYAVLTHEEVLARINN